jgi:hypothetical protein
MSSIIQLLWVAIWVSEAPQIETTEPLGAEISSLVEVPSGQHRKIDGKSPLVPWDNQLFQWPFSSLQSVELPFGNPLRLWRIWNPVDGPAKSCTKRMVETL